MNKKRHDKLISFFSAMLLLIFHTTIFICIWYKIYRPAIILPYVGKGNYAIIFLYSILLLASNQVFGGLRLGYYKILDSIVARTLSLFTSYFPMYLVISLISYRLVSHSIFYLLS